MNQPQIQKQVTQRSTKQRQSTHADIPPKLAVGQIIAQKFKLIDKVGQGSFGMIFKTENIETGDIFATKFEKRDENSSGMSLLVREIKVLIEVQDFENFPQIVFYGRDEHYNYFMQTYLGYNLEQLLKRCNYKLSLTTVLRIGISLIERLKLLHSKNLIHRDLKPDNMCIGYDDMDQIYLIDFGLAKYFKDSEGKHIPQVEKKGIIGTARYASMTAHECKEQSRKDDIESLGYVLVYLAKGKLPWMNMNTTTKSEKYQKIKEFKQQITLEKLCEGLPKCFLNLFLHARGLDFQSEPNYGFLKDIFNKQLTAETQILPEYEWEKLPELKKRKQRIIAAQLKLKLEKQHQSTEDVRKSTDDKPSNEIPKGNSFLNVPILPQDQNEQQQQLSPDPKNKQSRNISQNISSFGTSQVNNYQISQLDKFKRQEQRNYTIDSKQRETSPNQKVFLKQATTKTERKMAFYQIDNDYREFDDIDQIASEETNIAFSNIIANFGRHKSTLNL